MDCVVLKTHFGDFPSDLVAKTPNSQSRGLGFYPGSGKETPRAATEKLACCNKDWRSNVPILRSGPVKWINTCIFKKSWFCCDGARQLKLKMHLGGLFDGNNMCPYNSQMSHPMAWHKDVSLQSSRLLSPSRRISCILITRQLSWQCPSYEFPPSWSEKGQCRGRRKRCGTLADHI